MEKLKCFVAIVEKPVGDAMEKLGTGAAFEEKLTHPGDPGKV